MFAADLSGVSYRLSRQLLFLALMGGLAPTPEDKLADGLVGLIGRVEQLQHKPHASEDQIRHILMAEAVC